MGKELSEKRREGEKKKKDDWKKLIGRKGLGYSIGAA